MYQKNILDALMMMVKKQKENIYHFPWISIIVLNDA